MMRRSLLITVILCIAQMLSAQVSLEDLVKGRVDPSKVVIEGRDAPNDTVIEVAESEKGVAPKVLLDALSKELYIIRQQYRLTRDGQYFGKNNFPFYGESFSLGIKVRGGMILSKNVIRPWESDPDFIKIKESGNFSPELYLSYQRPINDNEYKNVELELGTMYVISYTNDSTLYFHKDAFADFGLDVDEAGGSKDGYMVWIYTDSLTNSDMKISMRSEPMMLKVSTDKQIIDLKATNPDKLIGGLYVVPRVERGGRVQFIICGILVPDNKLDSNVCRLYTFATCNEGEDTNKKDNENSSTEPTLIEPTPINS